MPTKEEYQDNLRAETKIFGYNPKTYGYPKHGEIEEFHGKTLGEIVTDEDGNMNIITGGSKKD